MTRLLSIAACARRLAMTRVLPASARARQALWLACMAVACGLALRGTALDHALFVQINDWSAAAPVLWSALSVMGLGLSACLLAGAVGPQRPQALAAVLLAVVVGGVLVQLLKFSFAAERPLAVLGDDGVHLLGVALRSRSMPSGHAALAFVVAGMLVGSRTLTGRPVLKALVLLLALLTGLARIAVGAHWPSDVLAGGGLGGVTAVLIVATRRGRRIVGAMAATMEGRVASRLVSALLVAASCAMWVAARDYPLADAMHPLLALAGLWGAWRWSQLYPLPGRVRLATPP